MFFSSHWQVTCCDKNGKKLAKGALIANKEKHQNDEK
jgi:hypothetical protein